MIANDQHPPAFRPASDAGTVREVLRLALPLMVATMSQSAMWVVDTFIMGRVGSAQQGAVGVGGVLTWAATCFFAGTLTLVNVLVAQDFGAGRKDLRRHVATALLLVVPMSVLVLSGLPWINQVLVQMRVTQEALPHATSYVSIRLLAIPLVLTSFVLTSFLRGVGNTVAPMIVMLTSNVVNAIASAGLVFGWFGLPRMGVEGVAWGTVLASVVEAGLYWFAYRRCRVAREPARLPTRSELTEFLRLGLPIGMGWALEMVGWTAFSLYAATRPTAELAAHTVLFQVTGLCFMPAMALGTAASTLVGQYTGALQPKLAARSARSALRLSLLYMGTVGLAIAVFGTPLIRVFNSNPEVVELGAMLALFAGLYQPFDGYGIVAQGILRGAKQTFAPTLVMLGSSVFVFVPAVLVLGELWGFGIRGAWMAAVIHVVTASVLLSIAVRKLFGEPTSETLPDESLVR